MQGRHVLAMAQTLGPIASSIQSKLTAALQPSVLKIVNESHKHSGHWVKDGSAACDAGETHFKLEVVSEAWAGVPQLKRQQQVYSLLKDEMQQGLHALSMKTRTPQEAAAAAAP